MVRKGMTVAELLPRVQTARLLLTLPGPDRAPDLRAYVERNRDFFAPTSPPMRPSFFEDDHWRQRLSDARAEFLTRSSLRLVILGGDESGPVMGECNFTSIVRGPFQGCYLGYRLDQTCVGQGVMFEALSAAIPFAFEAMGLHRIMANYLPTNERSGRLLRRLGFTVEGYARDYLFVGGAWRDHVLTALVNPAMTAPPV